MFFMLLNESYKVEASERLQDISVVSYPHMKKHDASEVIQNYRRAAQDVLSLTEEDSDYSGIQLLKEKL